jgi:molybdopterin molybdotransferase
MKEFFKVRNLEEVLSLKREFKPLQTEEVALAGSFDRVLARDIASESDLPDFPRATMDGYAVSAAATFGATEASPAWLTLKGSIAMGRPPGFSINARETARIATGGMLPEGADAVAMIEHAEAIDDETIEVYKSVPPGQHVIEKGEDIKKGEAILFRGMKIRAQEYGLLAAMGRQTVTVFKKPRVGIISTGDEIVASDKIPGPGQIRDVNAYTLWALAKNAGAIPETYGIVGDDFDDLVEKCALALSESDMVLVSGGSSVGTRDLTIAAMAGLPDALLLVHGISISPGKPTILAKVQDKIFWGLPGHVVSAMVVFHVVVKPFIDHLAGLAPGPAWRIPAVLSRNIASAPGRTDFIRVKLRRENGALVADPVLGKSGLIRTMVKADGLIRIGINTEGLYKGSEVDVLLI